jgi:hypothetical protein
MWEVAFGWVQAAEIARLGGIGEIWETHL